MKSISPEAEEQMKSLDKLQLFDKNHENIPIG